jgi:fido (protein-threonine AMPylation protein)
MTNFDEYLRQGEPNKSEKAKVWKTAIGLQQVDGLKPSVYLIATAKQNIEGEITIDEVKKLIDNYYIQHPTKDTENRTEEADKVSARIAEILSEKTFSFSPIEYINIHRRLFHDIYNFAGKVREYNITKKEWVLDGATILYANADNLQATLEYDFQQEKIFNYRNLSQTETIEHIMRFISSIWQIHVFGEGNTRTTAIFLIKYLHTFGFAVNNELFESHSWYFRNALVRANFKDHTKNIHATNDFLLRFMENLLLGKNHTLRNRELHIQYDSIQSFSSEEDDLFNKSSEKSSEKIKKLIQRNPNITIKELAATLNISTRAIEKNISKLKAEGIIERKGSNKGGIWHIITKN